MISSSHMSPTFYPLPPSSPLSPNAFASSSTSAFNLNGAHAHNHGQAHPHSTLKRRADSPPSPIPASLDHTPTPSTSSAWFPGSGLDHTPKRRRPNLATNFSAMSLSHDQSGPHPNLDSSLNPLSPLTSTVADNASVGEVDDDGFSVPLRSRLDSDVEVEQLPDTSTAGKRPWHRRNSDDSIDWNDSIDDEDDDDDDEFNHPHHPHHLRRTPRATRARRYADVAQHPDAVEFPPDAETPGGNRGQSQLNGPATDSLRVDVLDSTPLKRKHREEGPASKRRRGRGGMDMDTDDGFHGEHVDSGPGWYEPEKDRIVVTSMSSSPPGSRSPSPPADDYDYATHSKLSQPGNQGFTISPSLLTHIMNAQRDFFGAPAGDTGAERGLVLYRPLGIPAGVAPGSQPNPQAVDWSQIEDSGRFEELGEEAGDDGMQVESYGPGGGSPWMEDEEDDDAMEMG